MGSEMCIRDSINSEIRLPKPDTKPKDWKGGEELHPFWLVRRSEDDPNANMTLGYCEQTAILTSNVEDLEKRVARPSNLALMSLKQRYRSCTTIRTLERALKSFSSPK